MARGGYFPPAAVCVGASQKADLPPPHPVRWMSGFHSRSKIGHARRGRSRVATGAAPHFPQKKYKGKKLDKKIWKNENRKMTIRVYRYILRGTAQGGQTWRVAGVVRCEWGMVLNNIMQRSYQLLTQGKAVYGSPGLGCRGPYEIVELSVEKAEDDEAVAET